MTGFDRFVLGSCVVLFSTGITIAVLGFLGDFYPSRVRIPATLRTRKERQ